MRNKRNKVISGIVSLVLLTLMATTFSFAAAANPVAKTDTKATKGDFIKGAQLWAANCSRCHNLRSPKDYTDEQWKPVIYHMRIRAGLTGQETRDIIEYLQQSN